MVSFVLRRLVGAIFVLWLASIAVFSLLHLAEGDPAVLVAGPDAGPEVVEAIRKQMGLDRPAVVQYFSWLGGLFVGDLGESYIYRRPVAELIAQRIGSTIELTILATLLIVVLGVLFGVLLATTRSRALRRVFDAIGTMFLALPPFASGVILIFLFAVSWQVFPSGGEVPFAQDPARSFSRLILPALALALPIAPIIGNLLATEMAQARDQEFIMTALAKGAGPHRITWRHAVPNSLNSPIIELSIHIGNLLGGAVVAEAIFTRNGVGTLLVQAVQNRDYYLALALLLIAIAIAIVLQFLAEIVIARIDPRIRLGVKK